MIVRDLNCGLLVVLGAVSWLGLCIFNAISWCGEQAIRQDKVFAKNKMIVSSSSTSKAVPTFGMQWLDWIVLALLANIGVCCTYHLIKRGLLRIGTDLKRLSAHLDEQVTSLHDQTAALQVTTAQGFQTDARQLDGVRLAQQDIVHLIHRMLELSQTKSPTLTPQQAANIERSQFYLQQISECFVARMRAGAGDGSANYRPGPRRTMRSVRSELILKRLSRELIRPIRKRYTEQYLLKERLLRNSSLGKLGTDGKGVRPRRKLEPERQPKARPMIDNKYRSTSMPKQSATRG